jgi:hypothetical protein
MVECCVVHDPQKPGAKAALAAIAVQAVIGAQQGVLAHIVGLVRTNNSSRDPKYDRAVTVDQLLKGPHVSVSGALDERGVVRHGCQR